MVYTRIHYVSLLVLNGHLDGHLDELLWISMLEYAPVGAKPSGIFSEKF